MQQVNGQHILIVRGIGGREVLAEQLRRRGALVDYADCYYRTIVDRPSGELGQLMIGTGIQAVIVHSGESLDYFVKLVGDQYRSQVQCLPLLVPSERIAQQARQYGFNAVITADNASSEAMVAVLEQLGTA